MVQHDGDRTELRQFGLELERLMVAIRRRYLPAAERLGCSRLVDELRISRLEADQGTLYSVNLALRECLRGEGR